MIKIFFLNGIEKGKTIKLDTNVAHIGRLPDNDIQIKDKTVSRKHLRIEKREDKFILKDLKSKNGTFLRGKLLIPDVEFEIEKGIPFAVGKVAMSLESKCTESVFNNREMTELALEFSSTAMFTASQDRPMTPPKNMDFLFKVTNILNQSLDINDIMQKVLDYLFELLKRIDRGFIILVDEKTGEYTNVISRFDRSANNDMINYNFSKTIVEGVIKSRKAITILDTFGQDDADISESMELMHVKSVMCVPLISREKVRGVIYVDSVKIPYGFREEDLSLLTAFSSPAAISIENALLYNSLEQLLEEKTASLNQTEKKLGESEKRYKAMFNNLSSGVMVFKAEKEDKDFIILDFNRADSRIEKVKKKDAIGKSIEEVFPEIRDTGLIDALKRVSKTGKSENCSITVGKDDSEKSWREYYIYKLPDGELVAIFDDVTEKKNAELEQKALQEQLFAAQKMESIGAFAGGTAHNFRNILQAISGNIEYLELAYGEKPEVTEIANNIYGSIDKGVGLINNLLHFAKRGWKLDMDDLDLSEVISKTLDIIEKVFNKNIEIKMVLKDDLWVKGDPSLLSQAFMNLFTNARDAMPNGGELTVKTKKIKNTIIAYVSDTGHGIDKDVIDKIFDPFFTLKDVGSGTGLGLSTTHGIIEQHKGTITVSSKVGEGTTFKIALPESKTKIKKKMQTKCELVTGKGQKILIIDDEVPVLESMANLVTQLGYTACPVNNPAEAVLNYEKLLPDMVLIDRSMPVMDGVKCIKELIKKDPDARIVIISGYEMDGLNGIDEETKKLIKGYLTKPCNTRDLSNIITRVLSC